MSRFPSEARASPELNQAERRESTSFSAFQSGLSTSRAELTRSRTLRERLRKQ
jgi:hypothetical protein